MIQTDVVIVGAGPSGLFAGFQAGMLGIRVIFVDILPFVGGQCSAMYPEKLIFDIGGIPSITAQGLVDNLCEQIKPFNHNLLLNRIVVSIDNSDDGFLVKTSSGDHILCKSVLLSVGKGVFTPNRPTLSGIETFEEKSVFYSVRDVNLLSGKKVCIAGGGDSSVDWCISLVGIAEKVYLIHRRSSFRCSPHNETLLMSLVKDGKVALKCPFQLSALHGENGFLTDVIIKSIDNNDEEVLDVDILLPFFGMISDVATMKKFSIEISDDKISIDPATMSTSRNGIFAIGDAVKYGGKMPLISLGFAESAIAMRSIYSYVFPDKAFRFVHSTTTGIPTTS